MASRSPYKKTVVSHAKLGTGARFAALKASLAKRGGVRNPSAVAASIGRRKYGAARMANLAAAGRRHSR